MTPSIQSIQLATSRHFGVPLGSMRSPARLRVVARPRQVAMYLAWEMTPKSVLVIAREFSRDHSTVIYACKQVLKLAWTDRNFRGDVVAIRRALGG